jgi:hypothetical protein
VKDDAPVPPAIVPAAVCVSCRTVMPRIAACDCEAGPVVDLRSPRGRALLRRAVWGSNKRQKRLRAIGRAGATGLGLGGLAELLECGAGGVDGDLGIAVLVVAAAGALFAGVAALVSYIRTRREEKAVRNALRPYGARGAPALASISGGSRARVGVAEGETFRSPLRREECLAFEISLRVDRPDASKADLVWREAGTAGFSVRLDDGELVRIPAGPIRLSRPPASARVSHQEARARLPVAVDEQDVALRNVPSDAAFEHLIRPGDRVAVVSVLKRREDSGGAQKNGLRAPARMALYPVGTPVVATLDD